MFKTFSHQFDVVLELAAKVENPDTNNWSLAPDSVVDKLIFKSCDIITMTARDVDLDYATKDTFQTDAAISSRLNGKNHISSPRILNLQYFTCAVQCVKWYFSGQQRVEDRELEPWVAPTGLNGDDTSLELEPGANGWDANDMFRKNEQIYGVQSTYDQSLSGYTVQLQASDTAEYK